MTRGTLRLRIALTLAACAATQGAWGQDGHQHDLGRLDVSLAGKQLSIELDAPAQNVLGFEYEPFTLNERQASEQVTEWLQAGRGLFELPAEAGCELSAAVLRPPDWIRRRQEERDNAEVAREVFQGEKVAAPEDSPHVDYHARYHFQCEHPDRLDWIDAKLLERLKGGVRLEAQVVTAGVQKQHVLSKDSMRIPLGEQGQ